MDSRTIYAKFPSTTLAEPDLTWQRQLRAIVSGSAGNLVEWYDFYTYAAFSLYFAGHFFPHGNLTAELMNTAAVFAVGFIARPFGAVIVGKYCDRNGRRAGLMLTLLMMGLGTLMIALSPSFETIGWGAPLILVAARVLQGFSVGGEYGASATYLSEMASPGRRGFWASFQYVTLIGGQLCALSVLLLLQQIMPEQQIENWGWRIPFLIGAALVGAVFFLRRTMTETPAFCTASERPHESGLRHLWNTHRREFIVVAVATAGGSLAFYSFTTYMQKYLVNTTGFDRVTAARVMTIALVVYMLAQPLLGALSDWIGRRRQLLIYAICTSLLTVPAFHALSSVHSPIAAFAIITGLLLLLSAYTAIGGLMKAELFPTHTRTLGVAVPFAIGNSLFGGTAEFAALWFKSAGVEAGFYWYVAIVVGVSTCAIAAMPKTPVAMGPPNASS
ncbi:MAG: MFS transporter [Novosphingobium sp.]